jgi:hypothetical protein
MHPTGISATRTAEGTVVRFDTRYPEARKAIGKSLALLGPEGRELKQAEAGVRMALDQRKRAADGWGSPVAARYMLRSSIRRLRRARAAFEGA